MSARIFTTMLASVCPAEDRLLPSRATTPRLPHTAALGDPGERTGEPPEHGERVFLKVGRQMITLRRSIGGSDI